MNTQPLHPPKRRVLRTALEVLVAIVALVPALIAVLTVFGVSVDGDAIVAVAGAAVMVATTVVAVIEAAGPVPIVRTLAQIIVAVVAIVPAVVALLAEGGIHVNEAQLAAITGLAVLAATTVQNLLEHRGVIPELGYSSTKGGARR